CALPIYAPKLSPFPTAVATGSFHIVGPLADFEHLKVDGIVDSVDMRLLATRPDERDYPIRNAAPIRISLADQTVTVDELELVGEETRLRRSGRPPRRAGL